MINAAVADILWFVSLETEADCKSMYKIYVLRNAFVHAGIVADVNKADAKFRSPAEQQAACCVQCFISDSLIGIIGT